MNNYAKFSSYLMLMVRLMARSAALFIGLWVSASTAEEAPAIEQVTPIISDDSAVPSTKQDPDQAVTSGDYAQAYQALQLSDLMALSKQPAKLLQVLDEDNDGSLSASEVSNARRALLEVDTNNDGVLSSTELGLQLLNPAVFRLHKLHRLLDVDGDNQISTQEVVETETRLRLMDADGNWMLDKSEFSEALSDQRLSAWLKILNLEALAKAGREAPLTDEKSAVETFYLLHQTDFDGSFVVGAGTQLLNINREVVHQWPAAQTSDRYGAHVELLENGLLLRTMKSRQGKLGLIDADNAYSQLELVDWNGNVIWSYQHCAVDQNCFYGPVITRQNGNVLVLVKSPKVNTAGGTLERQHSILELKPNYENKSTAVVASWPIENLSVPAAATAETVPKPLGNRFAYTEEQEQFLVSSHDGEKLWVIERADSEFTDTELATNDAYEIVMATLLEQAEIEVQTQVQLLEVHWLSDLPGKGDIALLLDIDANQVVLELALPMNKNGTYANDRRLEVVRRLEVFNERKVTGVRPTANGQYQLVLGDDSQVEIGFGSSQYQKRLYGKGRIADLKIYAANYAAFADKANVQTNLVENAKPKPAASKALAEAGTEEHEQLSGIWSMMIETTIGDESSELTLVQNGELIAGSLDGEPLTIALDGDNIELTLERVGPTGIVTIIYNGVVSETEMYGEYSMATGPTIGTVRTWTASR